LLPTLRPEGVMPEAGPVDDLTRGLRRRLHEFFNRPVLDAHVDLLDTRGAWYAEMVLHLWSPEQPPGA
jgi:hypothetical protein